LAEAARLAAHGTRLTAHHTAVWLLIVWVLFAGVCSAQDSATGALRGTVEDAAGARVAGARVVVTDSAKGFARQTITNEDGGFTVALLAPGEYRVRVEAAGMAPLEQAARVEIGGTVELTLRLRLPTEQQTVEVTGEAGMVVATETSAISAVLDETDISELPLNGRRFADLALLTPNLTTDPRSLTSATNGDLAYGGIRGVYSSYLVDGADNNNAFFAQARGRYRAPYQFSNEVVQEFRVSSNTYGAELGRAGGAVINVVTRSGSNHFHGTGFYYLRDSSFNATPDYVGFKPQDRQHQFGGTLSGPIKKNRAFFFAGFDQHIFEVPTVVYFLNGYPVLMPTVNDFEYSDYGLVMATAQALSTMGGEYRSRLLGNAGFAKLDVAITPRHHLSTRVNTSRYYGMNNVFFDPASPITTYAVSENGEEKVSTETASATLASGLTNRLTSSLRVQFSRDLQESHPNSEYPLTRIYDVIDGFERSSILPRMTREHRLHAAETLALSGRRHSLKFGGDLIKTWIYNFFPSLFGGEYIFSDVTVDPWTFAPQTYGMRITPLRAYAHMVPRYYIQNFGTAVSHPDATEYAGFAQDTIRVTDHLGLTLGVRYDFQAFRTDELVSNYYYRDSGRVPVDRNNVAPRFGFAYSIGNRRPLVIRGGYGLFYTRIPSMYTSAIETDNGARQTHLFLSNSRQEDRPLFPEYPAPLVSCPAETTSCSPPASLLGRMTAEVSAFARNFQIPVVQQTSLSVEKEIGTRTAVGVNYLYVRGMHLMRARDVNLPPPTPMTYPVYDESGANLLGYYTVDSFATWDTRRTLSCPFPPCLGEVQRPMPQLGSVTQFESASTSVYHGLTVSFRRRMRRGFGMRLAYTWARAMDDGQDALVVGRPATVQNSYAPNGEWGLSTADQRHRFVASWTAQPQPFHHDHPTLRWMFNDWRLAGVVTIGSGRPVSARIVGDANGDGNTYNDRLPGYRRNAFTGPDYATTNLRVARKFVVRDRWKLELLAESFNLWNRANRRVEISDDGFLNTAATFVQGDVKVSGKQYPASFRSSQGFLSPTSAYAPRQIQLAVRVSF
jgi:Carboxypeptidase regulatory-like domain/TonB dependent receptor